MIYFKRNLPHFSSPYGIYFITFRLKGSLPVEVVRSLRSWYHKSISAAKRGSFSNSKFIEIRKKYFFKLDEELDSVDTHPNWLKDQKLANILINKAKSLAHENQHEIVTICVMPNHVHLLIDFSPDEHGPQVIGFQNNVNYPTNTAVNSTLSQFMKKFKGSTAYKANQYLNRKGSFWQSEYFDYLVRNYEELQRIIRYICQNPHKAGLVNHWKDWAGIYINSYYVKFDF